MNVAEEARKALAAGLGEIIQQFKLPTAFPPRVLNSMELALKATADNGQAAWMADRRDAGSLPLVTLDPATSTDLDQAFYLEADGDEIVLSYALADLSAFVASGSALEQEAWTRGVTIYGLTEKIPLYPKPISQGAASLLPDGPRPAVLIAVAVDRVGEVRLKSIERVVCQSRAKLAYDNIDISSMPLLEEFAQRMWANEVARGASRVEFPQQVVVTDPDAPGGIRLALRARNYAEAINSTMSLAVNLAIGKLFKQAGVGLFRIMPEPSPKATQSLRRTAHVLKIKWNEHENLRDLQRRLDPENVTHQRFLLEARRSGGRATYETFVQEQNPWHSAIAATYSHATAPMRRLADRYVLDLADCLLNDRQPSSDLLEKLERLPQVMERYEARASNVDRAVIDLLEAVSLQHRIGEVLLAEVVDAQASLVQTEDSAIRTRALELPKNVKDGDFIHVRIDAANPKTRKIALVAT